MSVRLAVRAGIRGTKACYLGAGSLLLGDGQQVAAIFGLSEFAPEPLQVVAADESFSVGDFLRTAYPEPLALFQRPHEFRSVKHRIRCPGIEPCEAAPQPFDL